VSQDLQVPNQKRLPQQVWQRKLLLMARGGPHKTARVTAFVTLPNPLLSGA
jgi:hypothetical protein